MGRGVATNDVAPEASIDGVGVERSISSSCSSTSTCASMGEGDEDCERDVDQLSAEAEVGTDETDAGRGIFVTSLGRSAALGGGESGKGISSNDMFNP